jgi:hypothetical protein
VGRKCTAEDYQRIAEENYLVQGTHGDEDSKQQTKNLLNDRYKMNQQEGLDQWIVLVPGSDYWPTQGLQLSFLPNC